MSLIPLLLMSKRFGIGKLRILDVVYVMLLISCLLETVRLAKNQDLGIYPKALVCL